MRKHLYGVWLGMKTRCYNKNFHAYKNYGARGITVCPEWERDFNAFFVWAVENGYQRGLSIDRINNDLGYSPSNCRWTDWFVQNDNRSVNRKITFLGNTRTVKQWSKVFGVSANMINSRIRRGWNELDALLEEKYSGLRRYKKVECVETGVVYESMTKAASETKCSTANISHCLNGRRKTAGGYHWKLAV